MGPVGNEGLERVRIVKNVAFISEAVHNSRF